MRRLWPTLIALLGLTLLAAPPASAAVAASIENRTSGSPSGSNNLIGIEPRLSEETLREKVALAYELASDDAVAAKGARAEAEKVAELGDQVAGQRITLESTTGQRSVADIVTRDKGVVEVKSGGATLSPGQKAVQADIDAGRQVTPRGQNAADAGLEPGKPVTMKCYTVERCP